MKFTSKQKIFYSLGLILFTVLIQILAFTYLYNSKKNLTFERVEEVNNLYLTDRIEDFQTSSASVEQMDNLEVFADIPQQVQEAKGANTIAEYKKDLTKYLPLAASSEEIVLTPLELDEIKIGEELTPYRIYNPLNKSKSASLFFSKDELPIKIEYNSDEKLLDFTVPPFYLTVNEEEYSTNSLSVLQSPAQDDSVLSLCSDDYLYLDYFGQQWVRDTQYSPDQNNEYRFGDIGSCYISTLEFGKSLVSSSLNSEEAYQENNIKGLTGQSALSDKEIQFTEDGVLLESEDKNIYYSERYYAEFEPFEPYLLDFEFKNIKGGQIGYGYRFFKQEYLDRLEKELRGEKLQPVDTDIWDQIYEETHLEYLNVGDREEHQFRNVISTELPDIVGVEVFLFAPGTRVNDLNYPVANRFSNLNIKALSSEKEIDLYTDYQNMPLEVTVGNVKLEKDFNTFMSLNNNYKTDRNLILSEEASFESGLWEPLGNWTTKKSTEGMSMSISDIAADGRYSLLLQNSSEHTSFISKSLPVEMEKGGSYEFSIKLRNPESATVVVKYQVSDKQGNLLDGKNTLLELEGTKDWKTFSSIIDLNNSDQRGFGEGQTIRVELQLKSSDGLKEVWFDDLQLKELKRVNGASPLSLRGTGFNILNDEIETVHQLYILNNKTFSNNWKIDSENAEHYRTENNRNLWLLKTNGSGSEAVNISNTTWSYVRIFQWTSVPLAILGVFVIIFIEKVSKFTNKVYTQIKNITSRIGRIIVEVNHKFLEYNKKFAKKYLHPLLNKLFDTEDFSWNSVVAFRKKIFSELDSILVKIFNDLIFRPAITFGLIGGLLLMVFLLGTHTYYTILLFIFLFWLINGWDSRVLAFFALANLLLVPIMLIIEQEVWAERFSILVYFFLVMTVVLQIIEYIKEQRKALEKS